MKNLAKINQLENELSNLVAKEIQRLETISLIPESVVNDEINVDYWDWVYDLPIVNIESQGYYIISVKKTEHDTLLIAQNVDDNRDITELSIYELSLSNKIQLLQCANDVIEFNKKQTL